MNNIKDIEDAGYIVIAITPYKETNPDGVIREGVTYAVKKNA